MAQIDGLPERFHIMPEPAPEVERIEAAEAFFASIPATVNHGSDKAYYSPSIIISSVTVGRAWG
ncbi:hypothetical protein KRZ98_13885 [Sphingobium sp. AS12]|uniref:hypothetical protein n=1 Tax=Sphingobium sp. AS12 TaxID=2849495 RepID=UPI001C31CDCB|nr:hypothetical protein [Sphingobium sp. AS12]MBV2149363.1 hypothetical protein [Sphingobium sp. AS12]